MSNVNPFNHVIKKQLPYARHNLSYYNMMSAEFGQCIPFYVEDDLVPGDKARISSAILAKFAPFINPVYAEINVLTEFYFVPYRILQPDYIKTMSGGVSGNDYPNRSKFIFDTQFLATYGSALLPGSLSDYLGINFAQEVYDEIREQRITKERTLTVTSYRHKAYHFICNEYYMDQNLDNPVDIHADSLDLTMTKALGLLDMRYSSWKKDYFSSALPFAQRGGAQGIPIEGSGEVYYTYLPSHDSHPRFVQAYNDLDVVTDGFVFSNPATRQIEAKGYTQPAGSTVMEPSAIPTYNKLAYNPDGTLRVNFDTAQLLVENLRIATSIQQFFELKARAGGRDREFLFGQFGVDNKDMRLTIPQLIGGGVQNVVMSEILQQSQSTDTSPQGTRSGDANSFGSHRLFRDFYVTEPGLIMGIMRIVPRAQYMQGISRHLQKFTWEDDFNPFFQHLGEQPIKSIELYCDGTADDENVFGYAPRYAEYKWHESEIHGDFKESLDTWHLARIFPERPVLNRNFIEVRPDDANRIFAIRKDENGNEFEYQRIWLEIYNQANYVRPIMKNAIPQLI